MKKIGAILFYTLFIILLGFYIIVEINPNFNLSELDRLLLLCSSSLSLYFGGVLISKYKNNKKILKINIWIFFFLFLILFLTLSLFDPTWGRSGLFIPKWSKEMFQNYIRNSFNIIPFKTILNYIMNFNSLLSTHTIFYNLFGNLICLMPLGFFLPILFPKQRKTKKFLITITLFVLVVELLQFLTLSGSCDIDDIILNVSGAFILYLLLKNKTLHQLSENVFLLEKHPLDKKELSKIGVIIIIIIISLFGMIECRKFLYQQNLKNNSFYYDIEIIDESFDCQDKQEKFYEDSLFNYYFSCVKSNQVYVKINGKKYLVKEVLQYNSDVTINDLKQAGLTFIKEPKYTMIEIEEDNEYCYRTILSSNIVELKTSQVIYGEDYMNFDLYLIPQKEGTDLLEIQFFNMKTKELVQNEIYKIMVDKNLNVVYEKVEM